MSPLITPGTSLTIEVKSFAQDGSSHSLCGTPILCSALIRFQDAFKPRTIELEAQVAAKEETTQGEG